MQKTDNNETVDLNIPYLGWTVKGHIRQDPFIWDPSKVQLFLTEEQTGSKSIDGKDLLERLSSLPVVNANLLDYLVRNPELIPESWKQGDGKRRIYFWGTMYLGNGWADSIRCLTCSEEGSWGIGQTWISNGWDKNMPCVIFVQ